MGAGRAHATVSIDRSATEVLAVLRDISHQSEWWPGQYRSEALETDRHGRVTKALIGNDVKVAKDDFEVAYTHEPGLAGYSFDLAGPSRVQRSLAGTWSLTPTGAHSCDVTLELALDVTLPLPGFVVRRTAHDTVHGATKGLKRRCESA